MGGRRSGNPGVGVVLVLLSAVVGSGVATAGARGAVFPCGLPTPCPSPLSRSSPAAPSPPSPSPPVQGGAEYDGRAGDQSFIATVVVNHQATRVSGMVISFIHGRCSDGGRYGGYDGTLRNQSVAIGSDGAVTYNGAYPRAFWFTRTGRRVDGHERFVIRLRFAGDRLDGTLSDRFTSRRLRCDSGQVPFTAYRDGTPEAPLRTAFVRTGRYAGTSDYTQPLSMQVFLPLHLITSLRIRLGSIDLFCTGGLTVKHSYNKTFHDVTIQSNGFHFHGSVAGKYPGGKQILERFTMTGTFSGIYAYAVLRYTVSLRRNGRTLGSCSTAQFPGEEFNQLRWHPR